MTWSSSALTLALCALLAACQVPDADRTAEVTAQEIQKSAKPVAVVSREERGVASKLEGILKKDMAYADLRSVVLAKLTICH